MRAVIYARYSSENQREASIDDQVRVCRTYAGREGWHIVDVVSDYAISGATALRSGFQALLEAARQQRFDVVLAESLDRLSRDQEHIAGFYKQMSFASVRIVTIAEGAVSELHVGLKGTMGALYLKDLAQKTHRGLEGRVHEGRSAGGLSFGYRAVHTLRADGSLDAGKREIDEAQAAIVRRIFAEYVHGRSPRAIAKELNTARVPGPRGGRWTASLILGNATRETGILRNRLYAGEMVWNRQHFLKDPVTGKRVSRPNPPSAWIVKPVPGLRIIEPDLWAAAQARMAANRNVVSAERQDNANDALPSRGARLVAARRPQSLLTGLVRCGTCGGPFSVVGSDGRLGCANRRERGTCDNRRTVLRRHLEERVLAGLKVRLLTPALVEEFVTTFVAEVNAANRERGQRQARLDQERARLGRQIRSLLELMKDGHGSAAMVAEMRSLEQRQEQLAAEIAQAGEPEPVPALHPNLPQVYREKVERLEAALQDPTAASLATEALRSLIDAILVHPGERRGEVRVELRGDLAAFLRLDDGAPAGATGGRAVGWNGCSGGMMGSLVAGRGFEPLTFRL